MNMTATLPIVPIIKQRKRYTIVDKLSNRFLCEFDPTRDMLRLRCDGRDVWVSLAAMREAEVSEIVVRRVEA
jgi:hypothetical protein